MYPKVILHIRPLPLQLLQRPCQSVALSPEEFRQVLFGHLPNAVGLVILKQRHDCPLARRDKPGGVDPTSRVNGFPDDGLFAEGGIGEGGVAIKRIGLNARKKIEKLIGKKVYLELFVSVKKGWSKNKEGLKELGYDF